jgi:hypothetical protein
VFPEPRFKTVSQYIRADDEEEWIEHQPIVQHADFRYSEIYDNDTTVLYRKSRYLFFSTRNRMDLFELVVRGKRLLTAQATFTIRQVNGDVIYQATAPAIQALCPAPITDIVAQEDAMKGEIAHFFDHSNILQPAISTDEEYDRQVHRIDSIEYRDIYYDDQINGFMYQDFAAHGERIKIVYSRLRKKVIVYYRCCSPQEIELLN